MIALMLLPLLTVASDVFDDALGDASLAYVRAEALLIGNQHRTYLFDDSLAKPTTHIEVLAKALLQTAKSEAWCGAAPADLRVVEWWTRVLPAARDSLAWHGLF